MQERMSEKSRTQCGKPVSENLRMQLEFRDVGCRDDDIANIRIFARNFIYDRTKEKGERTMSKELMNTTEMKEVISKRTACMKVFEHADHRFTAAIYGTPVHYMKDGRWEEIDNRLEAAADDMGVSVRSVKAAKADYAGELAGESDAAEANSGDMENISGAFKVRLSNKVKKKQMVSLGEGSRKLTWGFVDANSVKRQILKETEAERQIGRAHV